MTTLPSVLLVPPAASLYDLPLLCCCHSFIVSSADSCASSLRSDVMLRRNLIQSRSCRIHRQGSIQSSNMTTRDSGIVREVKSGLTREAKAGKGSARKYNDNRASMSTMHQRGCRGAWDSGTLKITFVVGIQDVLVGISEGKFIGNWRFSFVSILWFFWNIFRC